MVQDGILKTFSHRVLSHKFLIYVHYYFLTVNLIKFLFSKLCRSVYIVPVGSGVFIIEFISFSIAYPYIGFLISGLKLGGLWFPLILAHFSYLCIHLTDKLFIDN